MEMTIKKESRPYQHCKEEEKISSKELSLNK